MELFLPLFKTVKELLTINQKITENIISKITAERLASLSQRKPQFLFCFTEQIDSKLLGEWQASHLC